MKVETEAETAERIRGLVEGRAEKRGRYDERREIVTFLRMVQVLINEGSAHTIGDVIMAIEARESADRGSPR